jgi:hypothetical protein
MGKIKRREHMYGRDKVAGEGMRYWCHNVQ